MKLLILITTIFISWYLLKFAGAILQGFGEWFAEHGFIGSTKEIGLFIITIILMLAGGAGFWLALGHIAEYLG